MKYLKENEIKQIIVDYILKEKNNYAILLDGDWGSGKTFFIKNKIIPKIYDETKKKSIYISLYGINDIKEIDRQIYFEIIEKIAPENNKINFIKKCGNVCITGYKVVNKAIFKNKFPMVNSEDITSIISLFSNIKNYILIFDDLERCNIQPNIVLGYINRFVEHKNCKCIIVANQKEIAMDNILDNIEMKYLVALDKRIKFQDKKKDILSQAFWTKNEETDVIEASDLRNRIEEIFNENIQYEQIKEKLIGNTIYYKPNLDDVLKNIIENDIEEKKIKNFIFKYSKEIIRLLEDERHINIRTLRIAIDKFAKIMNIVKDIRIDGNELLKEISYNMLMYTVISTVKNKTGQKEQYWEKNSEYSDIYVGRKRIVAFKFIDGLVNNGALNKENVENVINDYIENLKMEGSNLNDPLNKLREYWELEDEVIINNIKELIDKLERNEYKLEQYPNIIALFIKITNIGFDKSYLEKIVQLMENNIKVTEITHYKFDEFGVSINSEAESVAYNSIMQPIRKLLEMQRGKNREEEINDIFFTGDGWGERFCNYCENEKNRALTEKKFAKLLDIDRILIVINESNVKDISYFRRQLNSIYNFSNIYEYYKDDIENLNKLKKGLQKLKLDKYGKTKAANIRWLIGDIENILKKLGI